MKTFFRLLVAAILLGGWGIAGLSLHVVRARGDAIVIIPKQRVGLRDTYVDARAWTLSDVANHPAVVQRIVQSGNAEHFAYVLGEGNHGSPQDIAAALQDAARNAPPTTNPDDGSRSNGLAQQAKATLGALWHEINK